MTANPVDILLVEDNAEHAELAIRALRSHNLANSVHVAKDGAEALDYIFATGPDDGVSVGRFTKLVLLDLKLPMVGGLEVLRRIKQDDRTRDVPVVILTSSRENRDLAESYHLGANSYVVKPMDSDNFSKAVVELGIYWLRLNETLGDS